MWHAGISKSVLLIHQTVIIEISPFTGGESRRLMYLKTRFAELGLARPLFLFYLRRNGWTPRIFVGFNGLVSLLMARNAIRIRFHAIQTLRRNSRIFLTTQGMLSATSRTNALVSRLHIMRTIVPVNFIQTSSWPPVRS